MGGDISQIARSLGYARHIVRERIAQATGAGFSREGEWRAALAARRQRVAAGRAPRKLEAV